MKLLISAYACAPNHGSEHAVGWNWITEAHRLGHPVWALVAPNHRESIQREVAKSPDLAGITWLYPEIPGWPLQQAVEPRWERTYNLLWQIRATAVAKKLHDTVSFDTVHHLTWGGIRAPTFLGALGIPLILGPLGGGETSPRILRDELTLRARCLEFIRDLSNRTIRFNPIARRGLMDACRIVVKTPETLKILSPAMQRRSVKLIELGLRNAPQPRLTQEARPPKLLFAARLLYWKGGHLAIRSLAELRMRIPEARLTIVGKGREASRLRDLVARLDLVAHIDFVPWLPQQELFQLYQAHDLLLFPSLHDSSGGVVLEALSFGLPVVCLDLGGPKQIVTRECGVVVSTTKRNSAQVAAAMAEQVYQIFNTPGRLSSLSNGATARAGQFNLTDRVRSFYSDVERAVQKLPN